MATINQAIYEGFRDADGGEWIRIKAGGFKDVCWRPLNLHFDEKDDTKLNFTVEYLDTPETRIPTEEENFESLCSKIMSDIITHMDKNGN